MTSPNSSHIPANARSTRRRALHLASATFAALLIASCGGGDDSSSTPPPVVTPSAALAVTVLSSRADSVTSGSALVEIAVPAGIAASDVKLTAAGTDVTSTLTTNADGTRLRGLVAGLALGDTLLAADVATNRAHGQLTVTNHPRSGPVFSGLHLSPFECRTAESGLGAPLDADCAATTRYDWFYFTAAGVRKPLTDPLGARPGDVGTATTIDGKTVPFIVRVESGTINRSIYRIAVLDDPATAGVWNGAGWNRRVVFRFGESTAAQYNQGSNGVTEVFKSDATDTQSIKSLERGFAYVVSTLNINKVNVNDVLAAETVMMIREHIAKTYGVPRWLVGIMPDAAFPDVFSTALAVSDCRLLNRYFIANPATDATRKAFEGHLKSTCATWDAGNGDAVLATNSSVSPACGLVDGSKVYNPVTNPTGARCTVYDINVNTLGRNAFTGAANRPLDNVGVQYGLASLKSGAITTTQFLDLNERIGGFDSDGNLTARRTVADTGALKASYGMGRLGSGSGGLATTPILHMRAYAEPAGDIHTIYNDIKIREQLKRANGNADNQIIWLFPNPGLAPLLGLGNAQQLVLVDLLRNSFLDRLTLMTRWLDAIGADVAPLTLGKVIRLMLYAKTLPPRMVAGGPVTDDVVKCQLKPIADADYAPAAFTTPEKVRLAAIFPEGVCDFSRPGVAQATVKATWLKY